MREPPPATNPLPPRMFFLVGPLRTGSSLMARSIDDHEDAVCLCETEVYRALFPAYALRLHHERMLSHGFSTEQVIDMLSGRPPNDPTAWLGWYGACIGRAAALYGKPAIRAFGDKSPDLAENPAQIAAICGNHALIYTVRDPKAIVRSIWKQTDSSREWKETRWASLLANIRAWRPHWNRPNLLATRYEDLVRTPEVTMAQVYAHLGLSPSTRFLSDFPRQFPSRFLWETAVDMTSGKPQSFDPARTQVSDSELPMEMLLELEDDPDIADFRARFGYEA